MKIRRRHFLTGVLLLSLLLAGGIALTAWHGPEAFGKALKTAAGLLADVFSGGNEEAGDAASAGSGDKAGNRKDRPDQDKNSAAGSDAASAKTGGWDPAALPVGLTSIDGAGGEGVHRAVKKNGVWYPVYSPGTSGGSGPPPLNVIPLTISSGPPPPGRVDEPWRYQAEAIGGAPPFSWSATLNAMPEVFLLDPGTGLLTGQSAKPGTVSLTLAVTDAEGARDSVVMPVVIRPAKDLVILTESLPAATPGEAYGAVLEFEGGLPPCAWTHTGLLPAGLTLDAAGGFTGTAEEAGEYEIAVTLTDSQKTAVTRTFRLICADGPEITTSAALPPAMPGEDYRLTFEAEGGVPPYQWTLLHGAPPDSSWQLTPEGEISGRAPAQEGLHEFTVEVRDAEDASFEKTFRLAVGDFLIAVPSREKAGLAWQPEAVRALLESAGGGAVTGFAVEREGPGGTRRVYEGTGDNTVDRGLATGAAYSYTLLAYTADGAAQPVAHKSVTILPVTLERGIAGERGDPFADKVTLFQPLSPGGYGAGLMPKNVTGPPDGRGTYAPASKASEVLSLHAKAGAGGLIELEFTDNIVESGSGEDFTVFENVLFVGSDGNNRFMETATVSVALWPGQWRRFPVDVTPPAAGEPLNLRNPFYYRRGLAGRNGTTGDDPTNPARSGGDSFDLNDLNAPDLTWFRFIRIQSTGDNAMNDDFGGDPVRHNNEAAFSALTGSGSSGFDLDAVSAVNY